MIYDYKNRLSIIRERSSTVKRTEQIDVFYSYRSRVLYCSSFRRLQQKAQVFFRAKCQCTNTEQYSKNIKYGVIM
jgi:dGTP triphosphohydrolase